MSSEADRRSQVTSRCSLSDAERHVRLSGSEVVGLEGQGVVYLAYVGARYGPMLDEAETEVLTELGKTHDARFVLNCRCQPLALLIQERCALGVHVYME